MSAVREHPRKVIHVLRVVDELLKLDELDELAEHMRAHWPSMASRTPAVVMVQGDSKETLRPQGEPFAVARVRAAMFNAEIGWREFELDLD